MDQGQEEKGAGQGGILPKWQGTACQDWGLLTDDQPRQSWDDGTGPMVLTRQAPVPDTGARRHERGLLINHWLSSFPVPPSHHQQFGAALCHAMESRTPHGAGLQADRMRTKTARKRKEPPFPPSVRSPPPPEPLPSLATVP